MVSANCLHLLAISLCGQYSKQMTRLPLSFDEMRYSYCSRDKGKLLEYSYVRGMKGVHHLHWYCHVYNIYISTAQYEGGACIPIVGGVTIEL